MSNLEQNRPVLLIAEDEELLLSLLTTAFEDAGFAVLEARDGQQAVEALRSEADIQGVLTDVQMPGSVDGYEVAKVAREKFSGCTIVVTSGRAWPKPGDLAERAEFVPKPFRPTIIVQHFASLLSPPASL